MIIDWAINLSLIKIDVSIMKKQYNKPQMKVVKIQAMRMLAGSNPNAHDEVGGNGQFAPEYSDIDW